MSIHHIYIIENKINGKAYVGQTVNLSERWALHLSKNSNCRHLHRAIEKYGPENFEMSVVETLEDQNSANEKEIYWIAELETLSPNGYNLKAGGECGGSPSEETRQVMSIAAKNRRRKIDKEWRESMRAAAATRPLPSEETKEKIRQSKLGEKNPNFGKSPSEETRDKQRSASVGRPRKPETIERMRIAMLGKNKGKKRSQESINKRIVTLLSKPYCKNGHLLSETGYTPKKHPTRRTCRECNRINAQKVRERKKVKDGNSAI